MKTSQCSFGVFFLMLFLSMFASAQKTVKIYQTDGNVYVYDRVDSLICTTETQVVHAAGKVYSVSILQVDSVVYEPVTDFITPMQEVDLGLSVNWAGWNVGATCPEECGGYYAWGELYEKSDYDYDTYQYLDYANWEWIFIGDNISSTQYDVAQAQWGDSWRMPTKEEIDELINNCSWQWITYNGIKGQKITGLNGNSIFLPAAGFYGGTNVGSLGLGGYYWSGTLFEDLSNSAYCLSFGDINAYCNFDNRYLGYSVRPVLGNSTDIMLSDEASALFLQGWNCEVQGGEKNIAFTTKFNWSVSVQDQTGWCTVNPSTGAAGSHSLVVTVSENLGDTPRSTTLTLKIGSISYTLYITQEKPDKDIQGEGNESYEEEEGSWDTL